MHYSDLTQKKIIFRKSFILVIEIRTICENGKQVSKYRKRQKKFLFLHTHHKEAVHKKGDGYEKEKMCVL